MPTKLHSYRSSQVGEKKVIPTQLLALVVDLEEMRDIDVWSPLGNIYMAEHAMFVF